MATYGLWLWLLVNLNDQQVIQRITKRNIDAVGECPSHESRQLNSFLWALERNPPVYFFGTIHVPYTKVWDHIPANSERAFYESQNIYFELDLTDSVTLQTLAECQILPERMLLREVIPRTLFRRIRRHLSYIKRIFPHWITMEQRMRGLNPIDLFISMTKDWRKKRPIWIMLLLNALNEYDTKSRGVSVLDTFLIREAASWNKRKGSIESVEEQCGPLNALNNSQVIVALNQTLVLHEKIRRGKAEMTYSTKELIYHYNCGDLKEVLFAQDLSKVVSLQNSSHSSNHNEMEQARKLDEYLREELIYKRNRRMAKRVLKLIEEEPKKKFFFAFGAGHFLGNGSVIEILKMQGHNVTHIQADDPLPRYGNMRTAKKLKKVWRTRKRTKKRGRRRRRKQKIRMPNVDNLWKRIYTWTFRPDILKPTTRPLERTTKSASTSSSIGIDATDSSATSCSITAWLLWIYLFLITREIF